MPEGLRFYLRRLLVVASYGSEEGLSTLREWILALTSGDLPRARSLQPELERVFSRFRFSDIARALTQAASSGSLSGEEIEMALSVIERRLRG